VKFYLYTEAEFTDLERLRLDLHNHSYYFPTLNTLREKLDKIIDNASRLHVAADPRDGLTECANGPHFFDPCEIPEGGDTDRCQECQPDEDDHSDGESAAERAEFMADLQENR
jgi:hypothetical protein